MGVPHRRLKDGQRQQPAGGQSEHAASVWRRAYRRTATARKRVRRIRIGSRAGEGVGLKISLDKV
jgi:hypothetical protein